MWTVISLLFALGINFSIPTISESKKSIKTDSYLQLGFPFNYYQGENLTNQERNYRIKVIYVTWFTYLTFTSTLVPVTSQAIVPFPVASIERSITRGKGTDQEKLLLDLRGGGNDLSEWIIRILDGNNNRIHELPQNYRRTLLIEIIGDRKVVDQAIVFLWINWLIHSAQNIQNFKKSISRIL